MLVPRMLPKVPAFRKKIPEGALTPDEIRQKNEVIKDAIMAIVKKIIETPEIVTEKEKEFVRDFAEQMLEFSEQLGRKIEQKEFEKQLSLNRFNKIRMKL